MGRRLQRLRALDGRDRCRLIGCVVGLWGVHASLAVFGYRRTRAMIERVCVHPSPHPASAAEIAAAQALARLAASAGANALGEATCLRRALLLHGWLRRRGLQPALLLGLPANAAAPAPGDFSAHAWVELEGVPLLESDVGYRPFVPASPAPQA